MFAAATLNVLAAQQLNYKSIFGPTVQVTASTIDRAGNIYLAGSTTSDSIPVTVDAFQKTFINSICGYGLGFHGMPGSPIPCQHGFVVKIDPSGTKLLYATYLGGESQDSVRTITVDDTGNAFVTRPVQIRCW